MMVFSTGICSTVRHFYRRIATCVLKLEFYRRQRMGIYCGQLFVSYPRCCCQLTLLQNQSPQILPPTRPTDPRREPDRRRSQGGNMAAPQPAHMHDGSKARKVGQTPGGGQYPSAADAAHHQSGRGHPFSQGGYDSYPATDDPYRQQYRGASPMLPSTAVPPAVSNVRAMAGEAGVSQTGDFNQQQIHEEPPKPSLLRILTCRC